MSRSTDHRNRHMRELTMLAGIPFTIGAATVLGWWFGSLADRHFHTGLLMQALGTALGLAAAAIDTARLIRRARESE